MCGISAYIGDKPALPILYTILTKLEHRGYDSYGFTTLLENSKTEDNIKGLGPVSNYDIRCAGEPKAKIGIAHTRWSTNGKPSIRNAHPISSNNKKWYIVHNGIIENYKELKSTLETEYKYEFKTETDSEIIAALLEIYSRYSKSDYIVLTDTIRKLKGQYAFLAIHTENPDRVLMACNELPIFVSENNYISSEISSLSGLDKRCFKVENLRPLILYKTGDMNIEEPAYNIDIPQENQQTNITQDIMLNEIYQQIELKVPTTSFYSRIGHIKYDEIVIFGCGSSYYAGLLGQFFIEELAKTRCTVRYAADLQYHNLSLYPDKTLFCAISQSGETADTLQVLKKLKGKNRDILVITNNDMSQAAMLTKNVIYLDCGTEHAVASTKTYTGSVLAMLGLCTTIDLDELLGAFKEVLADTKEIEKWANVVKDYNHVLYLARYINYPIACEAALKLKEVANIHAEAVISSEIKHGPLALIDDKVLSIFILGGEMKGGQNNVFDNLDQVKARGGKCLVITNEAMETSVRLHHEDIIVVPDVNIWCQPLVFNLVAQLLAYHCAVLKGLNPAKCRHLSKSVTV